MDSLEKPWSAAVVTTMLKTPYFHVALQDVTVTDGTRRDYYTIHFPGPAVGVVACRSDEILLLRQFRFIIDAYVWAIPSGGVAPHESSIDAARRELEEESGYTAGRLRPLLSSYASYGCSDQRFEIFLAEDVVDTGNGWDENEVIEARWFTRDDVLAMIRANGIVDSLSLAPLLYVLLEGRHGRPSS